jgi:hypothetical protein
VFDMANLTDGDKGDITVSGGGLVWNIDPGVVGTPELADNGVTLDKLAQLATGTLLGRATAGTGNVEALSGTQATALLDAFSSTLKGLAPASGGGTANFLRADGTWATPATAAAVAGLIDVTQAPFSADSTGVADCREAAQTAAEYARDNGYAGIYFPPGDYKMSRSAAAGTNNYTCLSSIDIDGREGFSDFVIAGAGPKSRLFMDAPDDSDWYLIRIRDQVARVVIRDIKLDGNYTSTYGYATLTFTGQPSDGETVRLGSHTYTFKTALTPTAFEVLIGASTSASLDNLVAAINAGAGSGTLYAAGTTANTHGTAAAGAGDTIDVTATTATPAGLRPSTYTTVTGASWGNDNIQDSVTEQNHLIRIGGGTSSSYTARQILVQNCWLTNCRGDAINVIGETNGYQILTATAQPANNETVTLGSQTYTFKTTLTGAADEVFIGASTETTMDNLVAAVNAAAGAGTLYGTGTTQNVYVSAADGSGTVVNLSARSLATIDVSETMANASFTFRSNSTNLVWNYALTDELLISGNFIYDTHRTGIGVQRGCRRVVIDKNIINPANRGVIDFEPTGAAVGNDTIEGNASQQFQITNNVLVRRTSHNTVCTLYGIGATDRDDHTIFANNLCIGGGIDGLNVGPLTIADNIFYSNPLPGGDTVGLIRCYRAGDDLTIIGNHIERCVPDSDYISPESGGVLDCSVQPANNETVTLAGTVYTFKTTLTGAADEVLRGANLAASMTNLTAAVNGTTGAGTTYGTGTSPNVYLRAVAASSSVTFYASTAATVDVSETLANGTFEIAGPCIELAYNGGQSPARHTVVANHIVQRTEHHGIKLTSTSDTLITGNSIYGYQASSASVVGILADCVSLACSNVHIKDNHLMGNKGGGTWHSAIRFTTGANLAEHTVTNNTGGGATNGISWSGTPTAVPTVMGNSFVSVTNVLSGQPTPICIGGNRGVVATYQGAGVPSFTAALGSIFHRTDGVAGAGGAAGTLRYINSDGATTWVPLIDG